MSVKVWVQGFDGSSHEAKFVAVPSPGDWIYIDDELRKVRNVIWDQSTSGVWQPTVSYTKLEED